MGQHTGHQGGNLDSGAFRDDLRDISGRNDRFAALFLLPLGKKGQALQSLRFAVPQKSCLFKVLTQDCRFFLFMKLPKAFFQLLVFAVLSGKPLLRNLCGSFVHKVDGFIGQKAFA